MLDPFRRFHQPCHGDGTCNDSTNQCVDGVCSAMIQRAPVMTSKLIVHTCDKSGAGTTDEIWVSLGGEDIFFLDHPNIRQLRNAIERAALVAPLRALRATDLPAYVRETDGDAQRQQSASARLATTEPPVPDGGLKPALRAYETKLFEQALRFTGGNRTATAKLLRIPLRTLFRRLNELGVSHGSPTPASNE